mgnify:CR=1 FL=1
MSDCTDNCGPTDVSQYNPKKDRAPRGRRAISVPLFHVANPVPGEVEDSNEIRTLFAGWDLVPYAGSTVASGHSLLFWYLALAKLSSTHGTCISKLNLYAFGGNLRAENKEIQGFDTGEEKQPVPVPVAQAYRDTLFSTVTFQDGHRSFFENIANSYKVTGHAFVELNFCQQKKTFFSK